MKSFVSYDEMLHADSQLGYTEQFLTVGTSSRVVIAAAGTVAPLNLRGGGIALPTSTTDNSKAGVRGAGNIAVLARNKTHYMGVRLQYAEANTNAANLFVGFSSAAQAAGMQDNGAGPPANFSGIGFFKTDGGSPNWSIEASVGTTQITAELSASNTLDKNAKPAAGLAYQFLEITVFPKTDSTADVIFQIDGVTVYKIMDWVYTSIVPMAPLVMIQAGSTTAETLNLRRLSFVGVI